MDGEYYNSGMKREHDENMHSQDNNDAKKAKFDGHGGGENPPSRVVHIRSLPNDSSETDVIQLGMPFGKMSNILLLKQKSQAFLEFEDQACAMNMVSYFKSNMARIRNKTCYVQYSNHKELKTDQSNMQNTSARAAVQAAQGLLGAGGPKNERGEPTTILRVIVDNVLYPVTLEILHQLFSNFGKILKIITFTKNGTWQALIQYSDPISATDAKESLDNQNIYNGCNTLKIDYSKMANLNVKFNNDKSRDFTRPDLPTGDGMGGGMNNMMDQKMGGNMGAGLLGMGGGGLGGMDGGLGGRMGGGMGGGGGLGGGMGAGLGGDGPAFQNDHDGLNMGMGGGGFGNFGNGRGNMMDRMGNMGGNMGGMGGNMGGPMGGPCILVSNLDEEKVTPDALSVLFGVYGNVVRVKILFNKKDNALIQMADSIQARQAIEHLDKAKVWGRSLRLTPSKHDQIQMPRDAKTDAGLTKDFEDSPHHRFKRNSSSKNYIFSPTTVLHLYNVHVLEEDDVRQLFSQYGDIKGFKFFNNDKKMGLIEMRTTEDATHALMGLHNYEVGDNLHLRVSFSKSSLEGNRRDRDRRD